MKLLFSILLFAAVAAAQANPTAPAIPVDQQNANKARALIDQAIEALGGNAYLNIEDMTQEGRSYSFHHGEPSGAGGLFWRMYRFPDKERIELTKKRDVAYVYNGDQGYEVTYKGVRYDEPKAVSDFIRRRKYSLEWVLRKWLNEPGMALFLRWPRRRCPERYPASHAGEFPQRVRRSLLRHQLSSSREEELFLARPHGQRTQH
jgi:hypothetical protein